MTQPIRKLQPSSRDAFSLATQHSADVWEEEIEKAENENRAADAEWCRYMLRLHKCRMEPVEYMLEKEGAQPPKWAAAIGSLFLAPILGVAFALFAIVSIAVWPFAPLLVWAFYKPAILKPKSIP